MFAGCGLALKSALFLWLISGHQVDRNLVETFCTRPCISTPHGCTSMPDQEARSSADPTYWTLLSRCRSKGQRTLLRTEAIGTVQTRFELHARGSPRLWCRNTIAWPPRRRHFTPGRQRRIGYPPLWSVVSVTSTKSTVCMVVHRVPTSRLVDHSPTISSHPFNLERAGYNTRTPWILEKLVEGREGRYVPRQIASMVS